MTPHSHSFVLLLLLALAANLDNFGVGTAYGLARRIISPLSNLIIALMAVGLTYASMVIGATLSNFIPASTANNLGAAIIVGIGGWLIWEAQIQQFWQQARRWVLDQALRRGSFTGAMPVQAVFNQNSATNLKRPICRISLGETLILGISLALNAMAGGVGASLSGYNPLLLSLATGIFSYGTIEAGQRLSGSYLSKRFGNLAQPLAGVVLLGIGIYEFFV